MRKLPRIGIGQLLLFVTWLSFFLGLAYETAQRETWIRSCNRIVVSPNGNVIAVAGNRGTRIYKDSRLLAELPRTRSLLFTDNETLVSHYSARRPTYGIQAPGSDPEFIYGVYTFSIPTKSFVQYFPTNMKNEVASLLKDRILLHNLGPPTSFEFYNFEAGRDSNPISEHLDGGGGRISALSNDGRYAVFDSSLTVIEHLDALKRVGVKTTAPTVVYDLVVEKSVDKLAAARCTRFSPDGSSVIVCNGNIDNYDWETNEKKWSLAYDGFTGIQFSSDGSKFGVESIDRDSKRILIIETESSKLLRSIDLDESRGSGFGFTPDGESVWVPAQDGPSGIQLIEIMSGDRGRRTASTNPLSRKVFFWVMFVGWVVTYSWQSPRLKVYSFTKSIFVFLLSLCLLWLAISFFFWALHRGLGPRISAPLAFGFTFLITTTWMMVSGFRGCLNRAPTDHSLQDSYLKFKDVILPTLLYSIITFFLALGAGWICSPVTTNTLIP